MEESNSSFGFASTDKLYNTLAMTDTIKKMDVCWIVSARPHKATSLASLLKRLGFNIFQLSQRPKQYRHNERLATFSATFSWGNLFQRPKQYWKAEDAKTSYFMSTKKISRVLYYETVSYHEWFFYTMQLIFVLFFFDVVGKLLASRPCNWFFCFVLPCRCLSAI